MAFGLFKDGEELYNSALEEINRKEYDKAAKTLEKALDKKTGNGPMARAMIAFIAVGKALNTPSAYDGLRAALDSLGQDTFKFGLSTFDTAKLKQECEVMAAVIRARDMSDSDKVSKGNKLIEAAKNLMAVIGNDTLRINEYYSGHALSGMRMANAMMAEGNEILAEDAFWNDPQKAAEYQQLAYNFRRQNGESGERNLALMKQYSKACTCWFCGRQVVGEGMHYYLMPADPSPQQIEGDKNELQHSIDESRHDIYVCRACYSSISKRADAIANDYYQKSMAELRSTAAALQAQIVALEGRVSNLQMQISFARH